jgi:hypothetical protein
MGLVDEIAMDVAAGGELAAATHRNLIELLRADVDAALANLDAAKRARVARVGTVGAIDAARAAYCDALRALGRAVAQRDDEVAR